jgi:hypothetical protein
MAYTRAFHRTVRIIMDYPLAVCATRSRVVMVRKAQHNSILYNC